MILLALVQLAATAASSHFVLPNGLRVRIQEDHARPVALVQVTYGVGSLNERAGATGVAHYVEHMVYRATQRIRNEDVYGYIDRIGGRYTGGTWPEFTRYTETVPAWAVESALRVTAQRMCCALFDSTEFERERHNVVTEANGFTESDPASALRDAVMSAAFDVHPYRLTSNTWARDNLVLTRDEAFTWYRAHYGPNNAVLVVVGDVQLDSIRTLVERHFGPLTPVPLSGRVMEIEPPQRVEKRITLRDPGNRSLLEMVFKVPAAADPDFPALTVLDRVLSARLGRLAGSWLGGALETADSASTYPYVYRIAVEGDSLLDPGAWLVAIDSSIAGLARDGVAAAELDSARRPAEQLVAEVRATQQSEGIPPRRSRLTHLADSLSDLDVDPWQVTPALRERIRDAATRVTSADIQRFVRTWLSPARRTVGMLVHGAASPPAGWSDGRPMVDGRMTIPPLTTTPAPRRVPEPVPARALESLAPVGIRTARRVLRDGLVLRAARLPGSGPSSLVRIECDCDGDSSRVALAERLLTADARQRHADLYIWHARRPARDSSSSEFRARARVVGQVDPMAASHRGTGALVVSIVGSNEAGAMLNAAAEALASLPALPRAQPARPVRPASGAAEERIPFVGATQVAVAAALPGVPAGHPDRRALELLNYIVGVPSYGGRLGWALTKSGLTYASSAATEFGESSGHIVLSTECDTRNTDATIQAIREVVAGVGSRGVTEWELREAQAFTLGRTLLYGARADSPPDAVAGALVDSERAHIELLDPPALSRAYLAVTLDDLNRVARRYYRPDLLRVVAVGAVPPPREAIFPAGTFRAIFEP